MAEALMDIRQIAMKAFEFKADIEYPLCDLLDVVKSFLQFSSL